MISSYSERKKEEFKEKITLEYMNAQWCASYFGKKGPESLQKILDKIDNKPKKSMTDEQMLETVKMLNLMFGGEVK